MKTCDNCKFWGCREYKDVVEKCQFHFLNKDMSVWHTRGTLKGCGHWQPRLADDEVEAWIGPSWACKKVLLWKCAHCWGHILNDSCLIYCRQCGTPRVSIDTRVKRIAQEQAETEEWSNNA